MTLAFQGHKTRGNEIIEILELIGGNNVDNLNGDKPQYYYLNENNEIVYSINFQKSFLLYTVEQFKGKFPYTKGDKVLLEGINEPVEITEMKWEKYEVQYKTTKNDDWWVINDLKHSDRRLETREWVDIFYDYEGNIKKWEYCLQPILNVLKKDLDKAICECCELSETNFRATTCDNFKNYIKNVIKKEKEKPDYLFYELLDGHCIWSKNSRNIYSLNEEIDLCDVFVYYQTLCDYIVETKQNQTKTLIDLGYKLDVVLHYLVWSICDRLKKYSGETIETFFRQFGWVYDKKYTPYLFELESFVKTARLQFFKSDNMYNVIYTQNNEIVNNKKHIYQMLEMINYSLIMFEDEKMNKEFDMKTKELIENTNSVKVNEKLTNKPNSKEEENEFIIDPETGELTFKNSSDVIEMEEVVIDNENIKSSNKHTTISTLDDIEVSYVNVENFNSKFISALSLFKDDVTVAEIKKYFQYNETN